MFIFTKGMLPTDQWESIKQRFPRSLESEVTETKILHRRQVCFVD